MVVVVIKEEDLAHMDEARYWRHVYQESQQRLERLTHDYRQLLSVAIQQASAAVMQRPTTNAAHPDHNAMPGELSRTLPTEEVQGQDLQKKKKKKKHARKLTEIDTNIWKFLNALCNYYQKKACSDTKKTLESVGIPASRLFSIYEAFSKKYELENSGHHDQISQWFFWQMKSLMHKHPKIVAKRHGEHGFKYVFKNFSKLQKTVEDAVIVFDPEIVFNTMKEQIWMKLF